MELEKTRDFRGGDMKKLSKKQRDVIIAAGLLVILICLPILGYICHPDTKYSYSGVETDVVFKDSLNTNEELHEFITSNPNFTVDHISDKYDEGFSSEFTLLNWNLTENDYWFDIEIEFESPDLIIHLYYITDSKNSYSSKDREEIETTSEPYYLEDKQMAENLTALMIEEFKLFTSKDPEPYQFTKWIGAF